MYTPQDPFDPLQTLPADSLNQMLDNIEAVHDGDGLADGAVTASKLDFGGAGAGVWWEEIGRTTLSVAGDTISVASLPARKHIKVILLLMPTGGTISANIRFNNDSGNNYADRVSINGAADNTGGGNSSCVLASAAVYGSIVYEADIHNNLAALEKIMMGWRVDPGSAGAANIPTKIEFLNKWANTSAQITRVDVLNFTGTGDFAIGSEVIVLGHN